MINMGGWYWYLSGEEEKLDRHKCGKWMYFFDDQSFAQKICEKAIREGVCYECKCTDMAEQVVPTGVICFYLNGDDIANHKRVLQFMVNTTTSVSNLTIRLVLVSMDQILKERLSWRHL